MNKTVVFTAVAALMCTTAMAEDTAVAQHLSLGAKIETEFKEKANEKYGADTTIGLDISSAGIAHGGLEWESTNASALSLSKWNIGTSVGGVIGVSFGDQGGVFVEADSDHGTIATSSIDESLIVSAAGASVAVGFSDLKSDVTEINNIQGAYTISTDIIAITAAADYNMDSENIVLGGRVGGFSLGLANLGTTFSYDIDNETYGYEGNVGLDVDSVGSIMTYVNGDKDEMARNVGAEVSRNLIGLQLGTKLNYDIVSEEFSPSVTVGFTF